MQTNSGMSSQSGSVDYSDYEKLPDINTLNGYYTDGDGVDQEVFAEMRSNVLLCAGEHYNRRQSRYYKRIRDSRELSQEQKLRLTKNHIQKICKLYANNIVATGPGIGFMPKDEKNLHDEKVAEMHHNVWRDAVERYNINDRIDDWCDSFVQVGEVHVKLFFDPSLGNMQGYEPQVDPETGDPMLDEFGEPMADESKPVFDGAFVWEEIYGFNLLRPPEAKSLAEAEWLCIRKMTNTNELLRRFKGVPDIQKLVRRDQDETFMVFDPLNGGYKQSNKQTMLREYYFRPSLLFPQGYYYITTKEGILAEGELPGGFFPIVSASFEKIQTTPRGRSPVKVMRPYQAEINRAASKMAEHQITLGDDKLLLQNGTKASAGVSLPGIRTINYTGATPEVLQGRSGDQYLAYMTSQIAELYEVMMVREDSIENDKGQLDPYVLLFQSAKHKKKFQRYINRFEKFLKELVHLYLRLAKIHLPDDMAINAFGTCDQVNISEFRALPDTVFEIILEPQSEDIETKLGKQIVLNNTLQYVGSQLKPEDIGKLMRQMPFANFDKSFDDFTLDYDCVVNDMLALDRGEQPPINQYDNHPYNIKKLVARTRKGDFKFLPEQVQQNYFAKIKLHQEFEAANQASIQRAQQGMIPMDGALIPVDFYVNAPNSTGGIKQQKAKIPYFAIDWLLKQMEAQGASQESLANMVSGVQAQIADQMMGAQQPPTQPGGGFEEQLSQIPQGMTGLV